MFTFWETIKVCLLGCILVTAIAATWQIQNWRWEAKQKTALQELALQIQNEAKKEAKAAAGYEKKREATNEKYKAVNKALQNSKQPSVVCLDPDRLRVVNSALSRKAPDPTGPSLPLPGPVPAK